MPVHAMPLLRRLADEKDGFRDVAEFQAELHACGGDFTRLSNAAS